MVRLVCLPALFYIDRLLLPLIWVQVNCILLMHSPPLIPLVVCLLGASVCCGASSFPVVQLRLCVMYSAGLELVLLFVLVNIILVNCHFSAVL